MGDLIERLEAATVGSRELDAAIWRWTSGWQGVDHPPAYTTSLDAALALAGRVLAGVCWSVGQNAHHKHWTAYGMLMRSCGEVETISLVNAATPPLALCIAILRAIPEDKS